MNEKEKMNTETPEGKELSHKENEKETVTLIILTSVVVILLIIAFLSSKRLFESESYNYDQDYNESEVTEPELKERMNILSSSPIFSSLDNNKLNALANGLINCSFEPNQKILYQNLIYMKIKW